ncbi:hypothetical protein KP509_24G031200 [Ceratopteris richardii]|uniref:Uncharacterized protein n=1 Tax=Ceratopteris richardii TaxID=49495 RepID=A0A8T2RV94_CERRI|nr:hypothetical protein KP509_24G031200 [Ceratopteris richardii]KAH7299822.1 hypothetical protein KP509_24G031200 [Ceratopteris richardii]
MIKMLEDASTHNAAVDFQVGACASNKARKLSILPLVALIFYEVSGGPFGIEDTVKAGGPLLAITGFALFPFIWSIPEALVTAELVTAFPENGGYVLWISAAFGPFWGFQVGFWKWLSGVMDNALYPLLFLDYLKFSVPLLDSGAPRVAALLVVTSCLTFLNYRGITIVGYMAISLGLFSLLPFVVLGLLAIPRIEPKRWLVSDLKRTDWRGYLNSLFWNLNFWDKASTLAGEVDKPRETFPKALLAAVILVVFSYLIPLLAGTGALPLKQSNWEDGYLAEVAMVIGGSWMRWWVQAAAALSNMGLFEAEMSSDSFQLLGMSERGMLPELFAHRSRYGTPTYSILCSAIGVVALSWMRFQQVVEFLNFLYCCGMLLEFAGFIWFTINNPGLPRPFKIPCNTVCNKSRKTVG